MKWSPAAPPFVRSELTGDAATLHRRALPANAVSPTWEELSVERAALVVGSTQPITDVDEERAAHAGVDVVRRRSGGGAVWLDPESHWVDVTITRDDPRWSNDVGRAFLWLGDRFAAALSELGVEAEVRRGRLVDRGMGRLVCFAGVGPGEVLVDGRKLVGLSQRRTRDVARFQVVFYDRWDPAPLLDLLVVPQRGPSPVDHGDLKRCGIGATECGIDASTLLGLVAG